MARSRTKKLKSLTFYKHGCILELALLNIKGLFSLPPISIFLHWNNGNRATVTYFCQIISTNIEHTTCSQRVTAI